MVIHRDRTLEIYDSGNEWQTSVTYPTGNMTGAHPSKTPTSHMDSLLAHIDGRPRDKNVSVRPPSYAHRRPGYRIAGFLCPVHLQWRPRGQTRLTSIDPAAACIPTQGRTGGGQNWRNGGVSVSMGGSITIRGKGGVQMNI